MFKREGFYIAVKRLVFFGFVLIFSLLQNTDGLLPVFFGARLFPLIPLIISIGMYEGETAGLVYGASGGIFWDICSSGLDGGHAFFLAFAGCLSGILVRFVMRNRLITEYCICSVAAVLHSITYWAVTVYIPLGDMHYEKLLLFYLPSAVMTTAFSFVLFFAVKATEYYFGDKSALKPRWKN